MQFQEKELEGVEVLVRALKGQDVDCIFGVVGIPVVEVALVSQKFGIQYIGMRNEQAACYAAQAMGYLTGRPGVCLVVSGPGVLHALGWLANAKENCWPMVLIGGSSDMDQEGCGAFQEWPQVESCRPYCKSSARPSSIEHIPYVVQQTFKKSLYGRPGPCYIDVPGCFLRAASSSPICFYSKVVDPPLTYACPKLVQKAISLLQSAKFPLIIIGKGAAYARAEKEVLEFIEKSNFPFLPTPMGKGVVPDSHSLCVSAARSYALQNVDVALLIGARLNWMLHFGRSPRFKDNVKFIQIDICQEEFHTSVPTNIALCGSIKSVMTQMNSELKKPVLSSNSIWLKDISEKQQLNMARSKELSMDDSLPLSYYAAFHTIQTVLPPRCFFVSEGANTMDIGRAFLLNESPRFRLDAGTFGTMGVGLGFAIAAALWAQQHSPQTRIVCVEGDSAFGFSGLEMETIYRYKLPIVIVILNNNGIYSGIDEELFKDMSEGTQTGLTLPPTSLLPNTRYEKMASMFGQHEGYFCRTKEDIEMALKAALSNTSWPTMINIAINPSAQRKAQDFDWLTRAKL